MKRRVKRSASFARTSTRSAPIQKTEPYPGGQRWLGRLRGLQAKLARADGGDARRYRWFDQALADFGDRKKEDALHLLIDLHRRLSLLEDALREPTEEEARRSSEDIKSLLRGSEGRKMERKSSRQRIEEDRREVRREEVRREEARGKEPAAAPDGGGGRGTPVSVPTASGGSLSSLGWLLLGGLAWLLSSWAFSFT